MLLLKDAQELAAEAMDNIVSEDYGIDAQYLRTCHRRFKITVNDWTGNEKHFDIGAHKIQQPHALRLRIHDSIEELNLDAS